MTSALIEFLQSYIERLAPIGQPATIERFVLRQGTYARGEPLPRGVRRGKPRACFMNSARLATGAGAFTYVEGFAMSAELPLAIHHAWCTDARGRVVDCTLRDPETYEYIGVAFEPAELAAELLRTGVYGLFDTGRGVNRELLFRLDPELRPIVDEVRAPRAALA